MYQLAILVEEVRHTEDKLQELLNAKTYNAATRMQVEGRLSALKGRINSLGTRPQLRALHMCFKVNRILKDEISFFCDLDDASMIQITKDKLNKEFGDAPIDYLKTSIFPIELGARIPVSGLKNIF